MVTIVVQAACTFIATISFSIVMRVPRKYLIPSGIIGAVGWVIYLICNKFELSVIFSSFAGALIVAMLSHSLARILKSPVTVFLVTGLLPLVPGLGMYRIAYNIVRGENELAVFYFLQTFQIAGVIAMAILIMDTIFRAFQKNR